MTHTYFAGAIFTQQEIILINIALTMVVGVLIGLAVYFGHSLLDRHNRQDSKRNTKQSLTKSLLSGLLIAALASFVVFVGVPAFKSARQETKYQSCAQEIGYSSPAENNSNTATPQSQMAYRQCLEGL